MDTAYAVKIAEVLYDTAINLWKEGNVVPGSNDMGLPVATKMFVGVMNMAFSCEVAIKAKLQTYDKIHDLDKLFEELPAADQKWIMNEVISKLTDYSICWNEDSFKHLLLIASKNFENARYCFEDKSFMVSPIYLDTLARTLLKMHGIEKISNWAQPIKP